MLFYLQEDLTTLNYGFNDGNANVVECLLEAGADIHLHQVVNVLKLFWGYITSLIVYCIEWHFSTPIRVRDRSLSYCAVVDREKS